MKRLLLLLTLVAAPVFCKNIKEPQDFVCHMAQDGEGWDVLPSGLMMKWGYRKLGMSGTTTIDLDFGPEFTKTVNAQVSVINSGKGEQLLEVASLNPERLQVKAGRGQGRKIYYFVIGY